MTTTLKAILLITVAVAACGGSSAGGMQSTTPSPPKTLVVDSGGTACTKEQQQSIVFSGALSGTLTCATGKPECSSLFKGKVSNKFFKAAIHLVASGKPVQLSFGVAPLRGPGVYQADNSEGGTILVLDGPASWMSNKGDTITVLTMDDARLAGTFDSTLQDHAYADVHMTGSWACDRTNT